jgi:hypothetical protein
VQFKTGPNAGEQTKTRIEWALLAFDAASQKAAAFVRTYSVRLVDFINENFPVDRACGWLVAALSLPVLYGIRFT